MNPMSGGLKVAIYIITVCFLYLFLVTFIAMPPTGEEHSKTVIGFLMGTVFSTLLNYYWGSSSKQRLIEESKMDALAKDAAAKLEEERIEAAKEHAEKKEDARIEVAEEVAEEVIKVAQEEVNATEKK